MEVNYFLDSGSYVFQELLSKYLHQRHRDSIADLSGHRIQAPKEYEVIWERLNTGSFTNANSTVLFWMSESAI